MTDFQIKFARYNSSRCRTVISGDWFTNADNISDALANARMFIDGMRNGGCEDDVRVIEIVERGTRGIQCQWGVGTIWAEPVEEADVA